MCLPGVPVALKLVLFSFLAFALLMVLTAKARRAHFRYKHKNSEGGLIRGPGMPVPLVDQLKQKLHFQNGNSNLSGNDNSKILQDSEDGNSAPALSSMEATKRMLAQPSKFVDAEKKLKRQLLQLLEKQTEEQKNQGKVDPTTVYWVMVDYMEENEHADHRVGLHHDEPDVIDSKPQKPQQQQPASNVKQVTSDDNTIWSAPLKKAGDDATILLKPAFGTHRPSSNAILVFAEGYDLSIYLSFVESLANTGYSGDVVFSISNESKLNKESWLMLLDVRDVWFQLNPFEQVNTRDKVTGELHLFGENADAVRIGTSAYNKGWLVTAMGERLYLRCDQGFHNYLYYSGQLGKVDDEATSVGAISKLLVHEQGKGVINNLGALRTKPLKEWGMYDAEKELVLNWDGSTSPVAHQYDRDKEVNIMVKGKKKQFEQQWRLGKLNTA
ncbi:hypothetical protein QTG54_001506 [Skeletonema marinoi]|uniref:Uncharacterized protein n=1 Tax=Skeletonema marinoi TaxID=267567 RepID=A0AAD8YK85_9STRA|nr:hypothetical protein QTG54_001506 [Skeletonema marinoi]